MKFLILTIIAFHLVAAQSPSAEVVTTHKSHSANNDRLDRKGNDQENAAISRQPVKLNMKQGLVMNQVLGAYTLSGKLNDRCRNHSKELKIGLRAFEPWALQMFDASSKLSAGTLEGNLFDYGAYQQCVLVYKNTEFGPIRGKYCSIKVVPDLQLLRQILEFRNITRKRFVKQQTLIGQAAFAWALCVPDSCRTDDVLQHFSGILLPLTEGLNISLSLTENDCTTILEDEKPFSTTELSVLIVLGIFLLIVAVSTIVDFYLTPKDASPNKLVEIFSAYGNSRQIFARNNASSDLDCVHGIRFLSTCYVLIVHRYLISMSFPVINALQILDWVLFYRSTIITAGGLSVDTFFMVSGMMVSLGFFREVAKSGRMSWPVFYLHRYMRLTPPLALVVLIYATLLHHLGSGPSWKSILELLQKPCREYWWAVLLHVQNYVNPFPMCMAQTWYLTCDMQYYLFSPLILVPLWKWPIFGYINFILLYFFSVAIPFYLAWINNYDGECTISTFHNELNFFQFFYILPHVRAATYIIGLGFGYFIHKSKKIQISYSFAVLGWITAIATMLAALVGSHAFHLEEHEFNRLESSIYLSCSRSAWIFGIVWMVWACINGYGGPINSILSFHFFRVLGRIGYSIFLLHMILQYLMAAASKMPGYFSDFTILYAAFSDFFIMVIIGFAFTVCFESPLANAVALVVKKRPNRKVTGQTKEWRQSAKGQN